MLAERQVAAVLMAAGAKNVALPDPDEARDEFDRALKARPRDDALLAALGVR